MDTSLESQRAYLTSAAGIGKWQNHFLSLLILAVFLATGAQYVLVVALFSWFLWLKGWRKLQGEQRTAFRVLMKGVVAASALTLVGAMASWAIDGGVFFDVLFQSYHLIAQWSLRGFSILGGVLLLTALGNTLPRLAKSLGFLLVLHMAYLFAQRYFGFDWIHGFGSMLPEQRFNFGIYRVSGFAGHPLSLGFNAMLLALVAFLCAMDHRGARFPLMWWVVFACSFVTLLLSQTRYPLVILLGVIGVRLFQAWRTTGKGRAFASGLALVAATALFAGGMSQRFAELWDRNHTWEERIPRLVFWRVHWQMFQDHPVLGVGYANRAAAKVDYYVREGYTNKDDQFSAHNVYLQTMADSGLIGLAGLLFFLGSGTLVALRAKERQDAKLLYFMAAVWVAGLMQNTFRDSEFVFAYWMGMALLLAYSKDPQSLISSPMHE